jgi:diguanylate cyclase (GGDEF)-like protein
LPAPHPAWAEICRSTQKAVRTHLLIDQLATLAAQRNRDTLDSCFLTLFKDLLDPQAVAIYRPAGDELSPVWCIQSGSDDVGSLPDGGPPAFSRRQQLSSLPLHYEAWQLGQIRQQAGAPALTIVPMGCHGETHCLVDIRTSDALTPEQDRLVLGVQRFYGQLRALLDENERDSLTRLLNRKSFDETFVRMAMRLEPDSQGPVFGQAAGRRHQGGGLRCWLAVLDIDHFKRVNDLYGHLIGDEVLILVAQLMRKTFRTGDRLYRFGGEEFVVLLRSDDECGAKTALERLRSTIEQGEFPRVGQLTVSIGFTEVLGADTPSAAFERADRAVYHAKANGRNLVIGHELLVESGAIEAHRQVTEVEFF